MCSDQHEPAVRLEGSPNRPPGMTPGDVEDHLVALPLAGEVLTGVVGHAISPERARLLVVARAARRGHVCAERLRDLQGERPDTARGAVDQGSLARLALAAVSDCLERGRPGDPPLAALPD